MALTGANPYALLEVIHREERANIRESWGEERAQCFTWDDLKDFQQKDTATHVATRLKRSDEFREIVKAIRDLPYIDREALLQRARGAFRPTWAELGRISREGTTEAGQKAGQELAVAVVDAAVELLTTGPARISSARVFVGHGRSPAWRDLKDFLNERLGLDWDEFDREPGAGLSVKERLESMLEKADFAFLVFTSEDEHSDGSRHARENVIHEAGLFQGRLGFRKAIILLEDGCQEFSNVSGLLQIRFPKGNILARSEEFRRVLSNGRKSPDPLTRSLWRRNSSTIRPTTVRESQRRPFSCVAGFPFGAFTLPSC